MAPADGEASSAEEVRLAVRPRPGTEAGLVPVAVLDANRDVTFGYLLGYLSLALAGTLEYSRFADLYVGPWTEAEVAPEDRPARAWCRWVGQRAVYGPQRSLGEIAVVLSDAIGEPTRTFEHLAPTGPRDPRGPPARVVARPRRPRVDLVLRPAEGRAFDLFEFAREIAERFRRNLD